MNDSPRISESRRGRPRTRLTAADCQVLRGSDVGPGDFEWGGNTMVRAELGRFGFGVCVWLVCPSCERRAHALYLPPGAAVPACRACHGITYATRRADRLGRRILRLRATADRVGAEVAGLKLTLGERPPGRHRRRWAREIGRLQASQREFQRELFRFLAPDRFAELSDRRAA
ncbi:MAG: hypothetical protein FIB00_11985 [Chloroflexi bacterium]|nr:hypothetical protein [Dehalococcoidia bacterium]NJD65941.1 hypothetical protein [Chloroflexota bacterium]PWB44987.1 MAG: hypothetical protein C3F10_07190 [Dehalococcoidia bacterium]